MKKNITMIACTIFLSQICAWGQLSHEWSTVVGSSGADYSNSIATDADGNIYSTGRFFNVTDFDPGPGNTSLTSSGLADIFITKQGPNGDLIWAKKIGSGGNDYGYAIQADIAGNVIIAGSFTGTVDFDPGPGSSTFNAGTTSSDAFVVKLNSLGDFQWARVFTGTSNQVAFAVTTDAASNIILGGYFNDQIDMDPTAGSDIRVSSGGFDTFFAKFDPSGNYLWGGTAGSFGNDICYSITADASDNIYATGQFNGTVDFNLFAGSNTISSNGVEDAFVLKMNSSGTFQWAKTLGGSGVDVGRSIEADATGNVYTTGYFSGAADFDPSASSFQLISAGSGDTFVSKLDQSGNFIWAKGFGSTGNDYALSVKEGNGNVFIAGRFYATVDFDPNAGNSSFTSNGDADVYVLQLDDSGNYVDVKTFGGLGADLAFSVALTSPNLLYVAGSFDQTVNFDPSGAGSTFTSNGLSDGFLIRYSTCPTPAMPIFSAGSGSVCSGNTEDYTINTVVGVTSYTWTLPATWTGNSTTNSITTTTGTNSGIISVIANNACGSSTAATINVNVDITPSVFGNNTTICAGDIAQLEGSTDFGTLNWYTESIGGSLIATGLTFTSDVLYNDTTFYLESDNNGCNNNPRLEITVSVNEMPSIGINLNGNEITSLQNNATLYQWIDCNNSNEEIINETSQSFVPVQNGSYAVIVNLNGCIDTSACQLIDNLSINQLKLENYTLYPNPSNGKFKIEYEKGIQDVKIYSISGNLIYNQSVNSMNCVIINLITTAGIYIIDVTDISGNNLPKQRLIIQ